MKASHIKNLILAGGLLATSGCTKSFDAMNVSPNSPSAVPPQYLLTYGLERTVDRYAGSSSRYERLSIDAGECWIQHLGRNIYSNEGDNYFVFQSMIDNNWQAFFNEGQLNFQRMMILADEKGTYANANYYGIALVMRTFVFSILTDVYGPIPYSEAIKGMETPAIFTPKYDSQADVYAQMLADLKTANSKLSVTGPAIAAGSDIMFAGDILKWKKFANSLRLRLANRQAAKKPTESRAVMAEILGDPATYPIFTTVADNATLKTTLIRPSGNEWFETMVQGGRTDWNVSNTLIDKLVSLNDPRLSYYAIQQGGKWTGIPNGLPDAIATTYQATTAKISTNFTKADAPELVMTLSELNFILAEAAFDGDIAGGTAKAQTYFEAGIKASMDQYGLTLPASYLTTVGAVTKAKIMEQKWISLYTMGVEAWTEYRRTGLPVLPQSDARSQYVNDGVMPTRLPFPNTEAALNNDNMLKGVALLGGENNFKTKLWWAE